MERQVLHHSFLLVRLHKGAHTRLSAARIPLVRHHILWDRQFSSTDSSDFVPVLPEPVIQINAMEQTPNPLILHASYACLMDAGSHRILYSKNTDKKVPMASTTKIMTALLALESNKLNDVEIGRAHV